MIAAIPHVQSRLQMIPSPESTVDATQVLRRFRVVFNAVRSHFQQVEQQAGLGGAQVWALSVIRERPGVGMGEIAKAMDIHQSTASNLIKTLVRRELIVMTRHPADRRNAQLSIAPAGQAVLAKVPGPFEGVLPQALASLPAETLQRLDQDLDELVRVLKADEGAGSIPLAQL